MILAGIARGIAITSVTSHQVEDGRRPSLIFCCINGEACSILVKSAISIEAQRRTIVYKRLFSYFAVALASAILTASFQPFFTSSISAQAGCNTFRETGKTVCGRFLQYWQTHGGLAQQGYPISSQ